MRYRQGQGGGYDNGTILMDILASTNGGDEVLAPAADGGIFPVTVMAILALAAVMGILALAAMMEVLAPLQ